MRLYNLTDKARTDRTVGRKARDLLINGQLVKPGSSIEVPDDFSLATIAGWVSNEMLAVNDLPSWYAKAGRKLTADVDTNAVDAGTSLRDAIGDIGEQHSKKSPRKGRK